MSGCFVRSELESALLPKCLPKVSDYNDRTTVSARKSLMTSQLVKLLSNVISDYKINNVKELPT